MKPFAVGVGILLLGSALVTGVPAASEPSCDARPLAERLYERMKGDGRSDAEILDILGSGFKRGVLRGRVVDSSRCSSDQAEEALKELEEIAG